MMRHSPPRGSSILAPEPVPIAAGRPRKLTTLKTNVEELNTLWQIQQVFVPSLTMQSSAPSHNGTRAWNQLKAQEDSLGQYAYSPQAVAAPMLVSSLLLQIARAILACLQQNTVT